MHVLRLLVGLLPASAAKNWVLSHLGRGWSVDRTARLGPSVFWRVTSLRAGPSAHIGFGNTFRDMLVIDLAEEASVGQFNWFSGTAGWAAPSLPTRATLTLGVAAGVMSRHHLDCAGGITLGDRTFLSGLRSAVLTHDLDPMTYELRVDPVTVGDHCLLGSSVLLQRGVTIADRCVVGAGTVVTKDLLESEVFYAGVPAKRVATMAGAAYFDQTIGHLAPGDERTREA